MASLPLDSLWLGGMAVLLVAVALGLAGMGLLLASARMTREAVGRRIDLVRGNEPALPRTVTLAPTLIRSEARGSKEREQRETARVMARFHVPPERVGFVLNLGRVAVIAGLALLGYVAASRWLAHGGSGMIPVLVASAFGIGGWFLPGMLVGRMIKRRIKAVVSGLPDALELLVICVEAGLSFEDGIDRIAHVLQASQPALSEELALTAADLKILPSREQALANLASRVDMPSVRSVVTTLSQTLRYGTPLAQALRVVAGELRNDTLMHLEERANQLPTLMTIPMMLFIMPTIFMIVAGPAALRIIDTFKH